MDTTRPVRELFDDWAHAGRAEGMESGHGKTAAPLLEQLPIHSGVRFLDLGCGNGWAAAAAAGRGAEVWGIDAAPEMVKRAKGRVPGGHFETGDFATLPYPDGHFDLAWSMEAIYYAPDPDAVLREVRRVLRTEGAFHMVIDLYAENEASHGWPEMTGVPMVLRSEAEWLDAFQGAGFNEVAAQRLRTGPGPGVEAWKVQQGSLHVSGRA